MLVDGALDLYTMFYGWRQYDYLWALLAESGLIYLPFGWIVLSHALAAMKREPETAGARTRAPVLVEAATALVVMALAAAPMVTLSAGDLKYEKPCPAFEGKPKASGTLADSGTTYGKPLQFTTEKQAIQVPAWWLLVLKFSYGLNRAAIGIIPCVDDISLIALNLNQAEITDPFLLQEIQDFHGACYVEARRRYGQERPEIQINLAGFEAKHKDWMGSQIFIAMYYQELYAHKEIAGWPPDPGNPHDANKAANADAAGADRPRWGMPRCDTWWTDPGKGLRAKLLKLFPAEELSWLRTPLEKLVNVVKPKDPVLREDELIMNKLEILKFAAPNSGHFAGSSYDNSASTLWGKVKNLWNRGLAHAGVQWESVSLAPEVEAVKAAVPMIQSFLLMAIYMLLPFFMVLSGFRVEAVFLATVGIVGLIFVAVLRHIAWVLEQQLITSLWPDPSDFIAYAYAAATGGEFALKQDVLEIVLSLLYVGLPVIMFMLLGWAGYAIFGELQHLSASLSQRLGQAGRRGVDIAKQMAVSAATRRPSKP